MVAGHGDSNTEEVDVALNGNLIAGQPTIVCVGEATLATQLREAVRDWNNRLSGSASLHSICANSAALLNARTSLASM